MAADVFDIDEAAQDFKPVQIKFRGEIHVLGGSVLSLLNASSIFTEDVLSGEEDEKDDAEGHEFVKRVFEFMRPVLRALSPTMAAVLEKKDLTPPEEAALLKPVTEALNTLGRLSFRTEEEEPSPDPGDGSEVS